MLRFWEALFFAAMIGLSLQKEEASTDDRLQRKFLAIAQCEAINEHLCPSGLCTVVSALNETNERDDSWTPAQQFCDATCLLNDWCRKVCKCAERRTGKAFTILSDSKLRRLSAPVLHCREPSYITIKWDFLRDNVQEESVVFAVEMHIYGDLHWKPYNLTRTNIAKIEGLLPRQKYRFRVFAVGQYGVIEDPTVSESISTLPPASDFQAGHLLLDPPISIEQIGQIEYTNKSASVRIAWKPGQDATCTYEVMWYTDVAEGSIPTRPYFRYYNVAESPMESEIKNLLLNHTYFIYVKSVIDRYEIESKKVEMTPLVIKSCLAAFNHNLTICRPPKPEKLNIAIARTGSNSTQVTISYAAVKGQPVGYNVSLYDSKMNLIGSRLVPEPITFAVFENIPVETDYHAKVRAYSPAGEGDEAVRMIKMKKVKFSENSKYAGSATSTLPFTERTQTRNKPNGTPIEESSVPVIPVERAKPTNHLEIYLSVGGAIVVVGTVVVAVLRTFITRVRRKGPEIPELGEQVRSESSLPESSDLGAPDLHLCEQIGEGAFGTVWSGLLSDPIMGTIEVAVKMLKENPTAEESRHFENEMSILKSVKPHSNVVRFIGCITHTPEKKIIMEYCKFGDLQKFLSKAWKDFMREHNEVFDYSNSVVEAIPSTNEVRVYHNCPALANNTYGMMLGADRSKFSAELISFARQVASGMEFLTDSGILHRDLAARNVLIAGDRNVRISDFGLSREVLETSVYKKLGCERVAVKWIAPEALRSRVFTTKSDVWSYGILLWEIVTLGSSPYASIDNVLEYLRRGERLPQPCNCSNDLYEWMIRCWDKTPDNRPTFQLLREHMENLERSGGQHILLDNDKIAKFSSMRYSEFEERG